MKFRKTLLLVKAGSCSMPEPDNGSANQKSGIAYAAAFTLFMSVAALTGVGWAGG